jgi:hypothetical protein
MLPGLSQQVLDSMVGRSRRESLEALKEAAHNLQSPHSHTTNDLTTQRMRWRSNPRQECML